MLGADRHGNPERPHRAHDGLQHSRDRVPEPSWRTARLGLLLLPRRCLRLRDSSVRMQYLRRAGDLRNKGQPVTEVLEGAVESGFGP